MSLYLKLDPRLESSSFFITNLALSQVRLSYNAAFPWVLLIPARESVTEIIDLTPEDQQILIQEISHASNVMRGLFQPDKLNVASLGNVVPQLHVHIIARYKADKAWPNPVWNTVTETYEPSQKSELIKKLQDAFRSS